MKKSVVIIPAAVCALALSEIYRYAFCRRSTPLMKALLDSKNHSADYYERRDGNEIKLRAMPHEMLTLRLGKRELRGFYYPCGEGRSNKLAFIVHGYRSNHAETAGMFFEEYFRRGFDVFAPDNTASGMSSGHIIGYGVLESRDCLEWLGCLSERLPEDTQIVLHGFSMGGATVLKMCDRVPESVKFVISDSGFIDGRELLKAQLGPLYGTVAALNRVFGGYELDESSVSENIKNSRVPILIIHGEGDKTVPFSMAPRIYEAIGSEKDKLFTPEIRHIETMHYNKAAYMKKLDEFIGRYM